MEETNETKETTITPSTVTTSETATTTTTATTSTSTTSTNTTTTNSTKSRDRVRKKKLKNAESILDAIADMSMDEKVEYLSKMNIDNQVQIEGMRQTLLVLERHVNRLKKENEFLQSERQKSTFARTKLESLCRELQRQNKSIKEECIHKTRQEAEKRKEINGKLQTALNEVSQIMKQNTDKNLQLRDDNIEITNKFKKLCEDFKGQEDEVNRLTKQLDLEKQLAEATMKRTEYELQAEREIWETEKRHLIDHQKMQEAEKAALEAANKELKEHLSVYSQQYNDFENTIVKSNKMFDHYKEEIDRMYKELSAYQKEGQSWKDKWVSSQQTIIQLTNEHKNFESAVLAKDRQLKTLSDLCRSLQDERVAYLNQLKEHEITPVIVPTKEVKPSSTTREVYQQHGKCKKQLTKKKKELISLQKQMEEMQNRLEDVINKKDTDNTEEAITSVQGNSTENSDNQVISVQENSENKLIPAQEDSSEKSSCEKTEDTSAPVEANNSKDSAEKAATATTSDETNASENSKDAPKTVSTASVKETPTCDEEKAKD